MAKASEKKMHTAFQRAEEKKEGSICATFVQTSEENEQSE